MDAFFDKINNFIAKFIKNEKIMGMLRKLISKEMFLYLVFGVLTTVVNLLVFKWCNKLMDVMLSNVVAWVAAVIFAFVTNKLWVFDSKSFEARVVFKELISFSAARLVTLGVEEAGILIMIKWLHLDLKLSNSLVSGEMMIKILLAVIVVILNYIFSKLIIFKKKN